MKIEREEFLEELFRQGRIDQLDIDMSYSLQQRRRSFLGIFLAKAFRAGFMWVEIEEKCTPSPAALFIDDEMQAPPEAIVKEIEQRIVEEFRSRAFSQDRLSIEGSKIYFPYARAVEKAIIACITQIAYKDPDVALDMERAHAFLQQDARALQLHEDQKKAIETLLASTCGFLTGGPGTGKTFTAGMWLKTLKESALQPLHIALCAPTGRAAQTLSGYIQKMFGDEVEFQVQTIHRLLMKPFSYLPYTVLIVDECSMIDSALFAQLLARIRPGTRVLFLGDPNQLPPIDPGQPFSQLLGSFPERAGKASLTFSYRTESKEILEVAQAFLSGVSYIKADASGAVSYLGLKEAENIIEKHIVAPWEQVTSPEEACALLRTSVVLTPTRVGSLGTERINQFVRLRRRDRTLTPVVFLKNSHELAVMNGDLSLLERNCPLDYIHTLHQKIPAAICPRFEEAYAMSVHKSQGSEFHRVILIIPPGVDCSPNLLYTAATRARKELIVVG